MVTNNSIVFIHVFKNRHVSIVKLKKEFKHDILSIPSWSSDNVISINIAAAIMVIKFFCVMCSARLTTSTYNRADVELHCISVV